VARVGINPSSQDWAANGVNEGAYQHIIGNALGEVLKSRGHQVYVTRSNHDLSGEMTQLAQFKPNVIVSLHNDGMGSVHTGFQVIWHDTEDQSLRDKMVKGLAAAFPADRVYSTQRDGLTVFTEDGPVPHVLVESLNAENAADAKRLIDAAFQSKYVSALADGIVGAAVFQQAVIGPMPRWSLGRRIVEAQAAQKAAKVPVWSGHPHGALIRTYKTVALRAADMKASLAAAKKAWAGKVPDSKIRVIDVR
jgi:hypothetical protein